MNKYQDIAKKEGLEIRIDSKSGFCFGVKRAIDMAENFMKDDNKLFSAGDIVHNDEEIKRLHNKGMQTVDIKTENLEKGKTVLFRAHGEPPTSYKKMQDKGVNIIDATCPVVLKLQERVKKAWEEIKDSGGQIVIYGNKGHAEVVGLVGQTDNQAFVVENVEDIQQLEKNKETIVFSQTTKNRSGLDEIEEALKKYLVSEDILKVNRTICAQVGNRVPHLQEFVKNFDVVVFVAGAKSSNGRVLYEVCKGSNSNSFFASNREDINDNWFKTLPKKVGVCGATSTPNWLMEEIAEEIVDKWVRIKNNLI